MTKKTFNNNINFILGNDNRDKDNFTRLKSLIVSVLGVEESKVTLEAYIEEDLGVDSLDRVELITLIEYEFDIKEEEIDERVASNVLTVQDALNYIERRWDKIKDY